MFLLCLSFLFFVGRFSVFGKKEAGLFSDAVHLFWLTACKGKIIIRKTKEQGRKDEGTKRKDERTKKRGDERDEGMRGRRDEVAKGRSCERAKLRGCE